MKYGISSYVWTSPFSDETLDLFEKAKEMGFDLFELCIEDPQTIHCDRILPRIKAAGIEALVCGSFGPRRDIISEDKEIQKEGIAYIKQCVDIAHQLECSLVSGPMYSATGKISMQGEGKREILLELAAKNLQECAEYAEHNGVRLAIEPLNRFETDFMNTVDQAMEFLSRVDYNNVGLLLDTFHMNIEEEDMAAALQTAGSKVFNFHACSNTRGTPGKDHINWHALKTALQEIHYKGPIVIESFTPKVTEIARAVSMWRPLASSQDDLAQQGLDFLRSVFG